MRRILAIVIVFLLTACVHLSPAPDDRLFDTLDADKDGTVTMDELDKQKLVIETDEDGDKEVHQADAAQNEGSTTPMTFEQKRRLLEDIDQNKDGSINRQEWNRASPDGFILWNFQ
jgi:Ca2+-binding EF-hand superfamily protein